MIWFFLFLSFQQLKATQVFSKDQIKTLKHAEYSNLQIYCNKLYVNKTIFMFLNSTSNLRQQFVNLPQYFRRFKRPSSVMEGFGQLLVFSLVMLFGSYGAGSLPLFMSMSEKNLHLVSVLGAGLLLGVALAVIIPEGLQTLIKAYSTSPSELGIKVGL